MTTLAELTTPLTAAQVKAQIYAGIAAQSVSTTTWKPGAPVRTMIAVFSVVLAAFSQLIALIAKGGFLDLSVGPWLRLVAIHVYGVTPDDGSFARGNVTLTNTAGGVFTNVQPGDLIVRKGSKTYRNTAVFSLGASPATATVPVQADELGTASNAAIGEINAFVTSFVGVNVSNAAALIGTDAETEPALRQRCRDKLATLSPNGPHEAYRFVCQSTKMPDGTAIGITRVKTIADGRGAVDVYVADGAADVSGPEIERLQAEVVAKCEPEGVTATVIAAPPLVQDVAWEVWIRDASGLDDDAIKAIVSAALGTFFATSPIGGEKIPPDVGRIYRDAIEATIADVLIDEVAPVIRLTVAVPGADVDVDPTEAPAIGLVTGTIHRVASLGGGS